MTFAKSNMNLLNVFKIIESTLGDVIIWTLQVFIRLAIIMFVVYKLLIWNIPNGFFIPVLPYKLGVIVAGTYVSVVFNLVYIMGLASILKEKVKL